MNIIQKFQWLLKQVKCLLKRVKILEGTLGNSPTYTFQNGLNESSNNVKLGGEIIENTLFPFADSPDPRNPFKFVLGEENTEHILFNKSLFKVVAGSIQLQPQRGNINIDLPDIPGGSAFRVSEGTREHILVNDGSVSIFGENGLNIQPGNHIGDPSQLDYVLTKKTSQGISEWHPILPLSNKIYLQQNQNPASNNERILVTNSNSFVEVINDTRIYETGTYEINVSFNYSINSITEDFIVRAGFNSSSLTEIANEVLRDRFQDNSGIFNTNGGSITGTAQKKSFSKTYLWTSPGVSRNFVLDFSGGGIVEKSMWGALVTIQKIS